MVNNIPLNLPKIYDQFLVPPNVVRHMKEVAVVCDYICQHWIGPEAIDKKLVMDVAYIHDLANIIKFKPPFMGELQDKAAYWQRVQTQMQKKYGTDVHQALLQMVSEAGLNHFRPILDQMVSVYSSDNWDSPKDIMPEARVVELADCCVMPSGIVNFADRMQDLYTRYNFTEKDQKARRLIANKEWVQQRVSIDLNHLPLAKLRESIYTIFQQYSNDSTNKR